MFDIVLEGGLVADGSGAPARVKDVGIAGDAIAAVGDLSGSDAGERVDVSGLVVSPGFIDVHTHSDATLIADGRADSQVYQGVTTELIGQCGFSFAPVRNQDRMERWMVGRLPGVDANWRTFGEYLDALEAKDLGLNVAGLVGHGALRAAVLGDDVRQPSDDERTVMNDLLEESLDGGAWGMSSGLEYWPGLGADAEELASLSKAVARRDGLYASHVRNRDVFYDLGFTEAIAVGRVAGVRTQISHIQPKYGRPEHAMAHTLSMVDAAQAVGVDVGFDVIPHEWSHTGVASILPGWAREGGVDKMLERLRDPELRARMRANPKPMWRLVLDDRWDMIHILRSSDDSLIGRTIASIAEERGVDGWDTTFDLLLGEGDRAQQMLWTSRSFFADDIDMCVARPDCGVMSDTLAICRDGPTGGLVGSLAGYGWAARFLETYVRNKKLLSLEEGVRRLTALPAERIGLKDRGRLAEGTRADICVFDFDDVTFRCSIEAPREHPGGFVHVLANGVFAFRDRQRTSANAGRVLRAA